MGSRALNEAMDRLAQIRLELESAGELLAREGRADMGAHVRTSADHLELALVAADVTPRSVEG